MFVNPEVTAGLRRAGAQVVMSHELVHVATDAARGGSEPWLVEGFADYVALRDTGLPDRTTLGRAIEAARRDGVPDDLPGAADFDTARQRPAGALRGGLAGLPDHRRAAGGAGPGVGVRRGARGDAGATGARGGRSSAAAISSRRGVRASSGWRG